MSQSEIAHRPNVKHTVMVGGTKVIFDLPTSKGIINDVDVDEETGLCWEIEETTETVVDERDEYPDDWA